MPKIIKPEEFRVGNRIIHPLIVNNSHPIGSIDGNYAKLESGVTVDLRECLLFDDEDLLKESSKIFTRTVPIVSPEPVPDQLIYAFKEELVKLTNELNKVAAETNDPLVSRTKIQVNVDIIDYDEINHSAELKKLLESRLEGETFVGKQAAFVTVPDDPAHHFLLHEGNPSLLDKMIMGSIKLATLKHFDNERES